MLRRGNRHVDPMRTCIDARLAALVDLGAAHPRRLQKDCVVERAELDSGVARRLGRDVEPAFRAKSTTAVLPVGRLRPVAPQPNLQKATLSSRPHKPSSATADVN